MTTSTASPGNQQAEKSLAYYILSFFGLLLIFGFGHLPPIEPITPLGMRIAGIFMGVIFLWSFVGLLWPSLLGIIALGLSGYAPMRQVLALAFGDPIPILVIFAMILFGAIQDSGVTRYISRWLLTRKIINGRPVVFSFVFIYTTYILTGLSASQLPLLLLMWSILYGILTELGYKKGDSYTAIMVIGTILGTVCGQAAKPFTGSPLVMIGAYEKVAQTHLEYLPYMLFGIIMSTLLIICYTLLIKFIFRPDMSKIKNISIEHFQRDKLPAMNTVQKIFFFCLFAFLALVLLPSVLPKELAVTQLLISLGPWGVAIVMVSCLCLFKLNGQPVIPFKTMAGKHIAWDIYFLVMAAIVLAGALTSKGTGITDFLAGALTPLLGGHSSFMFAVIIIAFSVLITQFANNAVMAVILMPIIQIFSVESGANFTVVVTVLIFALHCSFLTPAGSPFAAILYGNKDWVDQKDILKYGSVIVVMGISLYVLIGMPVATMIFE